MLPLLPLEGLEEEMEALDDSEGWQGISVRVEEVMQQLPPKQGKELFESVRNACKLADEITEITRECRKGSGLRFDVEITSTYSAEALIHG